MTFYTSAFDLPGKGSNLRVDGSVVYGAVVDDDSCTPTSSSTATNGDSLVENLLHAHEEKFCTRHRIQLYVTTFNVNGRAPPESLHEWLFFDTVSFPDLVVIGLQEMDLALQTYISDKPQKQNEWLVALKKSLPRFYKMVAHVRLIGIFLVVYRNERSKLHLSDVHLGSIPTGIFRFGNKGGVGISMLINDSLFCFVNSHLAAGFNELTKRNQDYREISQMRFPNGYGIYDHEAVIWLGDLNYRLNLVNYDDVVRECNSERFQKLFSYDQLRQQQRLRTAFNNFQEITPSFRPTYKFDVGSSEWDTSEKRRIPAWCDRILWWTRDKNLLMEQSEYSSIERVVFSDHKPVTSILHFHAKKIDKRKRNAIYEEVLREVDRKANEMLPQLSLSDNEFAFGDVYLQQPAVAILTIRNTGLSPTHFSFAPTHDSNEKRAQKWLTVTPRSSYLEVGATVEVTLQVAVEDEQECGVMRPGSNPLNCILIIRLDQGRGRDYFVVVTANYRKEEENGKHPQSPDEEKIVKGAPLEGVIINLDDN